MIKRKMITLSEFEMNQKLKVAYRQGINDTVTGILAAMLICIHDKWGFGKQRAIRLLNQVNEQFASVDEGYVTIDDLKQAVLDDLGIDIQ